MLVLVAPGQGAQAPGFLTEWLDLPGAADRVAAWSDAIGLDLAHYGTKADADAIRDTAVAQPLLVAAGLLSASALGDIAPGAVAGHSVGEITAAALAGVLDDDAALSLVRKRGLAMADAAAITETGMAALLGGDPETTVAHLEKLGLTPANINGAGQIVAAGTTEQLAALEADKPDGVRRVVALKVAGAFHTHHMGPAVDALAEAAKASHRPTRRSPTCRTRTAWRSRPAPRCWSAWWARSPTRSAGTCAWTPSRSSASRPSWSSAPAAP